MNKEPLVASLAHVLDGKLKNLEQNAARDGGHQCSGFVLAVDAQVFS